MFCSRKRIFIHELKLLVHPEVISWHANFDIFMCKNYRFEKVGDLKGK